MNFPSGPAIALARVAINALILPTPGIFRTNFPNLATKGIARLVTEKSRAAPKISGTAMFYLERITNILATIILKSSIFTSSISG